MWTRPLPVDVGGMLLSILQIVALPVAAGLLLNQFAAGFVRRVEPVLPFVSIIAILAIIGAVVAGSQASIATVGPIVAVGVVLHNGLGLLGGYWGGRLLGFEENVCPHPGVGRWACRTPAWRRPWARSISRRWRRCQARCSRSGTICPARCWAGYWAGRNPVAAPEPARALPGES